MERVRSSLQKYSSAVLSKRPVSALCLWGEPGAGKTHLLQALLGQVPCRSFSLQAGAPTAGLTRVLPQPVELSPEAGREWERLAQGESLEPARLVRVVASVLSGLAPVVLHLENIHAATPEQRFWIDGLARILPRLRGVGLIVTARSPQLEPYQNLELPRLSREASDAVMRANLADELPHGLPQGLPQEGLEWIYARSLGNPLFGLEYLRYLSRQGFFWSDGKRWHWRSPPKEFIPPTLEALVYGWMNRYASEPSVRKVLEARAILPASVEDRVWAEVAGLELGALQAAKRDLEQVGMLRQRQLFHSLLGEVLLKELSPVQRRYYAAKALPLLEASGLEPSTALIADANLGQAQTLQIYQRLAAEAKAKGDQARAGHWLALAAQQTGETALALEAAQLLRHTDLARAITLAQTAAFTPPHDPEAVYLCAELWMIQGDAEQAETLLGLLPAAERSTQRWWQTLIRLHYSTHADHTEVLRLWELHPEFRADADPETVLYICAALGQRGQFEAAFALSVPLLGRDLSPYLRCRVHETQAIFHYLMGQTEGAMAEIERAVGLARGLAQPAYLAVLLRREGRYAENLNQLARAVGNYREALALLEEHGSKLDHAYVQTSLAPLLVDQGEYEEAEGLYLKALAVLDASQNQLLRCDGRVGLALLYLDWRPGYGGPLALRYARSALELARQIGNQQMLHSGLSTLAMAEATFGSPERALELARQSAHQDFTGPSEVRKARSLFALGLALEACGQTKEAIRALAECEQAHLRLGFELTAQRFGLELDRLTGNLAKARERLASFETQGLLGGARVALRYFPGLQQGSEVAPAAPDKPRLCLLGPALLEQSGQSAPYRGKKRLELLAYLMEARALGRPEATVLELMDALYPGSDEAGARAILKQLVYLLRNQLGPQAVLSTASGYALGMLETDLERLLQTHDTVLWRGVYLDGLGEGWFPEVRERLLEGLAGACQQGLETDPAEALRLGEIWQRMEPYDPQALALSLHALERLGEGKRLERLYRQGAARFLEVGERLPQSPQAFLRDFVTKV